MSTHGGMMTLSLPLDTITADATTIEERRVDAVVYREDLYPRIEPNASLIQRYAQNLDVLPPIEVNQDNILIDGFHRLTAHRKNEAETIRVVVTPTESDLDIFALAIERNARHGMQLSDADKRKTAIRLYAAGTGKEKDEIARILSVTPRSVTGYLADIDRQLNEERDRLVAEMYLACFTDEEIASAVEMTRRWVTEKTATYGKNGSASIFAVSRPFEKDADFEPPYYNVWTFAKKTNAVAHFGNSEQRIVDNLLYLYTEPFDIVVDPFAGGGSTIDVCKRRLRRYWVSDRKPIVEREREIRMLDIATDLPPLHNRWSDVTLTYLDPPYWKQAAGKYSKDGEDLANMDLDTFTETLTGIVRRIAEKQSRGALALLIQPTQWLTNDAHDFTDHVRDILCATAKSKRLRLHNRISCPYSTEQYNAQQLMWAKENKSLLVLTRELIVWKVG